MEVIQLMLKLFSLEVKDNDPMLVASEIKAIMHKIQASGMKPDLPLAAFVKSLYPTPTILSHCKLVTSSNH